MSLKRMASVVFSCFAIGISAPAFCDSPASVRMVSDKGSVKELQGETQIDAPLNTVWNSLTNYGNIKNTIPGYERSTVLQTSADGATVDFGLKAMSPFTPAFRYQAKIHAEKASNLISIQRVSGDFKSINASYRLVPINNGNGTLLVYKLYIDLGDKVPTLGASQILKSNTQRALVALQAHCAQNYRRSLTAQVP